MKKHHLLLSLTFALSSCATMISGTTQEVSFDSNLKGTQIYINNKEICQTPCITTLERGKEKIMVTAKKAGYEERTIFIERNINPTTVINVASTIFSTFGLSTDISSDSFWEYAPNSFYITMQKQPQTAAERKQLEYTNKIRHFILQNYGTLQTEIYDRGGNFEYTNTLSSMTKLPKQKIISIFENCISESECTERVINAYISQ